MSPRGEGERPFEEPPKPPQEAERPETRSPQEGQSFQKAKDIPKPPKEEKEPASISVEQAHDREPQKPQEPSEDQVEEVIKHLLAHPEKMPYDLRALLRQELLRNLVEEDANDAIVGLGHEMEESKIKDPARAYLVRLVIDAWTRINGFYLTPAKEASKAVRQGVQRGFFDRILDAFRTHPEHLTALFQDSMEVAMQIEQAKKERDRVRGEAAQIRQQAQEEAEKILRAATEPVQQERRQLERLRLECERLQAVKDELLQQPGVAQAWKQEQRASYPEITQRIEKETTLFIKDLFGGIRPSRMSGGKFFPPVYVHEKEFLKFCDYYERILADIDSLLQNNARNTVTFLGQLRTEMNSIIRGSENTGYREGIYTGEIDDKAAEREGKIKFLPREIEQDIETMHAEGREAVRAIRSRLQDFRDKLQKKIK